MKKIILGLSISLSALAFAQEKTEAQSKSPITFGVKGGMNISTISEVYDNGWMYSDQKAKIGFNAGVFANIPISEKFSLQPEILYSGLGAKIETSRMFDPGPMTKLEGKETLSLSYLSVPVMFQYNIIPDLYVEAGPEFGFLLGGRSKGEWTDTTDNIKTTTSYSDKLSNGLFNKFNFGIGIGAGYYFTQNLAVTARFTAGITDIYKHGNGNAVRNNAFQVGLAYKFK
ncbi:porin family protein [Chryseobacterium sp. OV279]|uniref:porin family protein n=1 Tax=Chryseobacterium sp. OV279 TaxID=1500285 RepID=UPI000912FEB9|nr:porin family protein [Chryseobacterium sp. OV279]SHF94227.1 Outer membrane protein beta-barrel domain-containing protein [Chryseobacterium sp. OV279]